MNTSNISKFNRENYFKWVYKRFRWHIKHFKRCYLIPCYLPYLPPPFTAPKIAWSTLSKPPLESILCDHYCSFYSFDDDSHLGSGKWFLWKKTNWIKICCSLTTTISYSTSEDKVHQEKSIPFAWLIGLANRAPLNHPLEFQIDVNIVKNTTVPKQWKSKF